MFLLSKNMPFVTQIDQDNQFLSLYSSENLAYKHMGMSGLQGVSKSYWGTLHRLLHAIHLSDPLFNISTTISVLSTPRSGCRRTPEDRSTPSAVSDWL